MVRKFFAVLGDIVGSFVQNPLKVFVACVFALFVGLVLDGNLFHIWRLHRDSRELSERIESLKKKSRDLDQKILRAQDPQFIEFQAREHLDLVNENDLIFVFADEE